MALLESCRFTNQARRRAAMRRDGEPGDCRKGKHKIGLLAGFEERRVRFGRLGIAIRKKVNERVRRGVRARQTTTGRKGHRACHRTQVFAPLGETSAGRPLLNGALPPRARQVSNRTSGKGVTDCSCSTGRTENFGKPSRSGGVFRQRGLRGREARDRHAIGRAGDVIETGAFEEGD
jgi:hypothetical protein